MNVMRLSDRDIARITGRCYLAADVAAKHGCPDLEAEIRAYIARVTRVWEQEETFKGGGWVVPADPAWWEAPKGAHNDLVRVLRSLREMIMGS